MEYDEELDFLEYEDLIAEREAILESEQPDEERLAEINMLLRDFF